jgi:hypothetical protein
MLCAIDVDGRSPLSSGCNGDSGGPLYTGTPAAPVVLGIVSWGGARCGADHRPDAGHPLVCALEASNDGGTLSAPFGTASVAHIPRY